MGLYRDIITATSGESAYWRFGETSGTSLASSVGSYPLSLAGTYLLGQSSAIANDADPSLYFNGGYATGSGTPFSFERDQAFSVALWFWLPDLFSFYTFVGNLDPSNGYRGWELGKEANSTDGGPLNFFMIGSYGSSYLQVHSSAIPTINAWHHYVLTYDGSSTPAGVKFYYDGAVTGQTVLAASLSSTTASARPLRFAARADGSTPLTGYLDETEIVGRVLTAAEVQQRYNYGVGNYGPLLLRRRRCA